MNVSVQVSWSSLSLYFTVHSCVGVEQIIGAKLLIRNGFPFVASHLVGTFLIVPFSDFHHQLAVWLASIEVERAGFVWSSSNIVWSFPLNVLQGLFSDIFCSNPRALVAVLCRRVRGWQNLCRVGLV